MSLFANPPVDYRLFNALVEIETGKILDALVLKLEKNDHPKVRKTQGWRFLWIDEVRTEGREVYKLIIPNTSQIQGLVSVEKSEGFYEMHLVETAPHNYGKSKKYQGILRSMIAFVCKKSFEAGFDGEVAFNSKSALIEHYQKAIPARLIYPPNRMAIFSEDAHKLVSSYFKNILE